MKINQGKFTRADRVHRILQRLHSRHEIKVKDLAVELGVSEVQIRNDIDWLEAGARLERHYGSIFLAEGDRPYPGWYGVRSQTCRKEKELIAAYTVANHIVDGDFLLLDGGSTVDCVCIALKDSGRKGLRIVSHDPRHAAHFLNSDAEFYQLGGLLDHRSGVFLDGPMTRDFFSTTTKEFLRNHCSGAKAIITGTAFSSGQGVSNNSLPFAEFKRSLINAASEEVLIVLDHSKFFGPNARHSVTHCGIGADEWLEVEEKNAYVIVDNNWASKQQAPAFKEFVEKLGHKSGASGQQKGTSKFREIDLAETAEEYKDKINVFKTLLVRK
jgi:DeoR/GlpR family transcriptional regulator of sugar metabolism